MTSLKVDEVKFILSLVKRESGEYCKQQNYLSPQDVYPVFHFLPWKNRWRNPCIHFSDSEIPFLIMDATWKAWCEHSQMYRFYNRHSLQIWDLAQSCTTRILIGFIHSPAEHTNLFVALGSRTGSSGDVPSENPQKIYKWMNYSERDFQWSIHSSGYLCNLWSHHNQEKRNSRLHTPSGFHHKLQKQNMIYLKAVIILVWGKI